MPSCRRRGVHDPSRRDLPYNRLVPSPASRPLGDTGLTVSALGLGGGHIGGPELSEGEVERLLLGAVDAGVTLVDTAPSYGLSEERIGRILASRRQRVVLSTKIGYGVRGVPDWTGKSVTLGIDRALTRLRTGVLDIVHLHSCHRDVLRRSDVVAALARAVEVGKVRVAAYSGDNEDLAAAVEDARLNAFQTSINPWDQGALDGPLARCAGRGAGVLAKRPLGGAPWRFDDRPDSVDCAEYWRRFHTLRIEAGELEWAELALRFVAFQPGVSSVLLGTRRLERLQAALEWIQRGPLGGAVAQKLRREWSRWGRAWRGVV